MKQVKKNNKKSKNNKNNTNKLTNKVKNNNYFHTPLDFRHFSWAISRHSGLNSLSAHDPNNSDTMISAFSVGTYFLISRIVSCYKEVCVCERVRQRDTERYRERERE